MSLNNHSTNIKVKTISGFLVLDLYVSPCGPLRTTPASGLFPQLQSGIAPKRDPTVSPVNLTAVTNLGLVMDPELSWQAHISAITRRCFGILMGLPTDTYQTHHPITYTTQAR